MIHDWVEETEAGANEDIADGGIHNNLRSYVLTLGPLALSGSPEVEQCRALLEQGVWILHTYPVDVIDTQLKLTCQLCAENERRERLIII